MTTYSLDGLLFLFGTVPCSVLTLASWPASRFLKRQVRWSGIPISFRIFHSYCDAHSQRLWHSQYSRNRCFSGTLLLFWWSHRCCNLISGSSAFSKTSLNTWMLTVHVLLKLGLEDFEHYFATMWDEYNCVVGTQMFRFVKIHRTVHKKRLIFIVYKLYLNKPYFKKFKSVIFFIY